MRKQKWLLYIGGLAASVCGLLLAQAIADLAGQTPDKRSRLITLGTAGGPTPRAHRAQSSNVLLVNGIPYIIDAGDGVARRLAKAGIKVLDVGTVFITHDHDDHTAGLATLLSVEWDLQRKTPVNVYGPPGTEAVVKGAIAEYSVNAEIRWPEGRQTPLAQVFVGHDVGTGEIYKDSNIRVVAVENTHFHLPEGTPPYGKYKSYSYRIEAPDRTIVFTGDTGPSPAVTALCKGADVLVSEVTSLDDVKQAMTKAGAWQKMTSEQQAAFVRHLEDEHLAPDAIAKIANDAKVHEIVLTHLPASADATDDYQRLADGVRRDFDGDVRVAKDLAEF